ncbi:hypothetical protein HKX48_003273 [Thoreauomyces humboldtii]|nr:hypothetical protein HKX48_003273 [Thoreauomyces humboldtii]
MTKLTEQTHSQAATGHSTLVLAAVTDRPDNRSAPAETADVEPEHTAGSDKHPAKEGNHHKAQKDHLIELDDKIEELKHDAKVAHKEGKEDVAKEIDRELNATIIEAKEAK